MYNSIHQKKSLVAAVLLGLSAPLAMADLMAPNDTESAAVLPAGVRNPRFKNLFLNVEDKFGDNGVTEPLGLKLNKSVTFQDILNAQKTQTDKEKVLAVMGQTGVNAADSAGTTTGQINSYADIKVPVFGYGVTDELTLAIAVPIVHIDISTDTGFIKSDAGQKFVNNAANSSNLTAEQAVQKINDGVNQKLVDNGYEPIRDQSTTNIGDVQLIGKYQFVHDSDHAIAGKLGVTLPTGKVASPDKVVDAATGDGQTDVTVGGAYDLFLTPELRAGLAGSYTAQLPDSKVKRIPQSQGSSLTPDKENVSRDLGDIISAGLSTDYKIRQLGFTLGAGYTYQYQFATTYNGGLYAAERYRWLEELSPSSDLHAVTASGTFSTVDWYKKKQFVYPFEAKIVYNHPLSGRNANANDVIVGELVLFF